MTAQDVVTAAYLADREDVYRYLLIVGLRPAEAQDATQEAFLKLHTAIRRGEVIRNPRAWVFRVAHNHALRQLTRHRNMQPLEPAVETTKGDPAVTPEAALLDRERFARL